MPKFEVVSEYKPAGDQPQAIEALTNGVELGLQEQTLLGVTGSGKTFTMASVIEKLNRPTLVLAHNKTLYLNSAFCCYPSKFGHSFYSSLPIALFVNRFRKINRPA